MDVLQAASFRGKQEEAVNMILTGRDTLYVFPTGTGKSLVYQVAGLCSPGITVVVSPLLGLLQKQVQRLVELGVPVVEGFGESLHAYNDEDGLGCKLVYCTPEQAREESQLGRFLRERMIQVERIVVDEAHLVCDWDTFRCVRRRCGNREQFCAFGTGSALLAC
jgi:ATP-dependent DNA helicase RecQ